MDISVRKHEDICILDIVGELKRGRPTELLRETSEELIEAGERFFVLNLLEAPWLDSSGIGEVVACYKRAREKKGVVKLALNDKARSQFTMVQLEKMFDIFENLDDAIASFDGPEGRYRERF
jgi:anti-sigma B factor antagonist